MESKCLRCKEDFDSNSQVIYAAGNSFHHDCFLCSYCFLPFEEGKYYEKDGFFYCYNDFEKLYAPICSECGKGIIGRVVRASKYTWHDTCFKCFFCKEPLVDSSKSTFYKEKICCSKCSTARIKDSYSCSVCKLSIAANKQIFVRRSPVHPWHFMCSLCNQELTEDAEEYGGKLFCRKCFDHTKSTVCELCKKIIKDERSLCSGERYYHFIHFCCFTCGLNLAKTSYYERNGLAYCEEHFRALFGTICCVCKEGITDGEILVNKRPHCSQHFVCYICFITLESKSAVDIDGTPVCKHCYEKLPIKLRKNLKFES